MNCKRSIEGLNFGRNLKFCRNFQENFSKIFVCCEDIDTDRNCGDFRIFHILKSFPYKTHFYSSRNLISERRKTVYKIAQV